MPQRCENCGFKFERGPGYWLGSIYVNYGLTALIVTIAYFVLFFTDAFPQTAVLWLLTTFCVLFPLWFFRYCAASGWRSIYILIPSRKTRIDAGCEQRSCAQGGAILP